MLISLATHGLFSNSISSNSTVVDLGAHRGEFSLAVQKKFKARVIAVEPSSSLIPQLRTLQGIELVHAAVTDFDGSIWLNLDANPQASTVRTTNASFVGKEEVRALTLVSLIQELRIHSIDVLKVDIEGSEVELIRSLPDELLKTISQITIELHDFNGMITSAEADEIVSRLCAVGFTYIKLSRTNRENMLFYQRTKCKIAWWQELWARAFSRNAIGVKRWLSRQRANRHHGR